MNQYFSSESQSSTGDGPMHGCFYYAGGIPNTRLRHINNLSCSDVKSAAYPSMMNFCHDLTGIITRISNNGADGRF